MGDLERLRQRSDTTAKQERYSLARLSDVRERELLADRVMGMTFEVIAVKQPLLLILSSDPSMSL